MGEVPPISNEVSDETGQFDFRFRLWRQFCADYGIPVNCLPSTLSPELEQEWKKFKEGTADSTTRAVEGG
jgi:hypothetical protein